jgi:hypothetical protein
VTAAAVGLLLVGVAWAAGDQAGDISSSGSQGTAADSSAVSTDSSVASSAATSSVATSGTASTGTSVASTTPTSNAGSVTSTSVDDNSTTSVSLVDTSTTSTTVGSTTSTSLDDATTSTTVDDNDREETRGPAPVNTAPTSYQVGSSGTVTVQISAGRLILIDATAASGWTTVIDRADGEEVRVEFDNGDDTAKFEARVHNGELRVRVEPS